MSCRSSCWLPVALVLCLLSAIPAQGAKETREVPIPGTGLSIRVPLGVAVWPKISARLDNATLFVTVDDLRTFEGDGVIGREDVLAQRAALAKGEAEVAEGWEEGGLSEVIVLPTGGNAVLYPWYSPFEYCALQFTMSAAFFVNNRRVTIRYDVSPEAITRENPGYFQAAGENDCEAATIWKQPGEEDDHVLERFHEALKAGRLGPVANAWYADFSAMLASLHRKLPKR